MGAALLMAQVINDIQLRKYPGAECRGPVMGEKKDPVGLTASERDSNAILKGVEAKGG